MRPFVNTAEFSPIVKMKSFPDFNSIYFDSFWYEQLGYIINGYQVGDVKITGYHYWYLNYWKILGVNRKTKRKEIINPRFLDLDYIKYKYVEEMYKQERDILFLKSRQKGFSEFVASILGCDFCTVPGAQLVIVAGKEMYSERTFNNLLRGLDELEETEFFKARWPDRSDYIRAAYKDVIIDEQGKRRTKTRGILSEAYMLTAKDNPQAVSRLTPSKVVMEEGGTWKKGLVKETLEFIRPSMEAEGLKTGYAIIIATGGDLEDSVSDIEEMFYNPEEFGLLACDNVWDDEEDESKTSVFIPSYMFELIDEDGNSLVSDSKKKIQEDRDRKKPKERYRAITQKPFTPREAFMISGLGYFGPEIIAMLNERRAYINTHKKEAVEEIGRLEWLDVSDKYKGVKFVPDEEDWWIKIHERPLKDQNGDVWRNLYKASTDSYDQDEARTSSSKGCFIVQKGFLNADTVSYNYCAKILERPETSVGGAETFYEHTAMASLYYGYVKNLIEFSKIRIIDWYVKNGFAMLLKERPEFVTAAMINKTLTANRYGIDPNTKPHWLAYLKNLLTFEYIQNMNDVEQITALAKFIYDPSGVKYNCDITIATALLAVYLEDDRQKMVMSKNQMDTREPIVKYKYSNGKIVLSYA